MVIIDVMIGLLLKKLLESRNKKRFLSNDQNLLLSIFWWFNPFSFTISTRGSSDGLPILAVVLSIYCLKVMKNIYISGVMLGLAIHLKLNSIIYAPTFYFFIDCLL